MVIPATPGTDYQTFGYDWTTATSFGSTVNATNTTIAFNQGLNASNTIRFGNSGTSSLTFVSQTGNLGLGTTSPYATLSLHAASTSVNTTLFTISSTTSTGATSTLFNINNVGSTTLFQIPGALLTTNAGGTIIASSTLSVAYGGTGLSTIPTFGTILVGNSTGGYTLTATSSLGLPTFAYLFPSNATTTILNFSTGILTASSTISGDLVILGNSTTTNATTTRLAISGVTNTLLKTNATGGIIPAILGTDYQNFAYPFGAAGNATTTLTQFNNGLTAFASSTIGSGTQANGLTIFGGATTTGFLTVQGAATSTFTSGISASALNTTASSTLSGLRLSSNGLTIATLLSSILKTDASGNVIPATPGTRSEERRVGKECRL